MRCNVNRFIREEIDVEEFCAPYDLCLLGDIHEELQLSDKIWYTNNPVNQNFEKKPNNGVLLVEMQADTRSYTVTRIPTNDLPQLVQLECTAAQYEFIGVNAKDYYRIEVTGTPEELREVKTTVPNVKIDRIPLISSVLASDAQLSELEEIDTAGATLEDELQNYLHAMKYHEGHTAELMGLYKEVVA
jgi:hypothetical protein